MMDIDIFMAKYRKVRLIIMWSNFLLILMMIFAQCQLDTFLFPVFRFSLLISALVFFIFHLLDRYDEQLAGRPLEYPLYGILLWNSSLWAGPMIHSYVYPGALASHGYLDVIIFVFVLMFIYSLTMWRIPYFLLYLPRPPRGIVGRHFKFLTQWIRRDWIDLALDPIYAIRDLVGQWQLLIAAALLMGLGLCEIESAFHFLPFAIRFHYYFLITFCFLGIQTRYWSNTRARYLDFLWILFFGILLSVWLAGYVLVVAI